MSISKKRNIDEIFKDLEDPSLEADFHQLDDMEVRLEKLRYFRFGWRHFNIYYTSLILFCFFASAWTLTDKIYSKFFAESQTVIVHKDSVVTIVYSDHRKTPVQPSEISFSKKLKRASLIINDSVSLAVAAVPALDSMADHTENIDQVIKDKRPDSTLVPKIVKPRKIVYVKTRDTIIQYDTTRVIRKK
jgi:hypothetical protein